MIMLRVQRATAKLYCENIKIQICTKLLLHAKCLIVWHGLSAVDVALRGFEEGSGYHLALTRNARRCGLKYTAFHSHMEDSHVRKQT